MTFEKVLLLLLYPIYLCVLLKIKYILLGYIISPCFMAQKPYITVYFLHFRIGITSLPFTYFILLLITSLLPSAKFSKFSEFFVQFSNNHLCFSFRCLHFTPLRIGSSGLFFPNILILLLLNIYTSLVTSSIINFILIETASLHFFFLFMYLYITCVNIIMYVKALLSFYRAKLKISNIGQYLTFRFGE